MAEEFSVYNLDDGAGVDEMQGPSSTVNQRAGGQPWNTSGAKSLAVLWFVALGLYWLLGILFRGAKITTR